MSDDPLLDDFAEFKRRLEDVDPDTARVLASVSSDVDHQDMIPVFQSDDEVLRMACLLSADAVQDAVRSADFDYGMDGGQPGIVGRSGDDGLVYRYEPVGSGESIPLIHYRQLPERFGGSVVELAEDFRLFWQLHHDYDRRRYVTTDEVGDVMVVAEWDGETLLVRKSYLRRYQAVRQLWLSLQVVLTRHGGRELAHLEEARLSVATTGERFNYYGGHLTLGEDRYYTRLIGKRILPPPPIEKSGVWPYEREKGYADFIVDVDETGSPITHTSDPSRLANYFGANPEAPHYLTPVLFDRSVLDRYYADPGRYQVGDGMIRSADAWTLSVDNALGEHVMVFLGDLGRDLPLREQHHWKAHNVLSAGEISETAFRRSFLAEFAKSDRVEHRLVETYEEVNEAWEERFGWPLFKAPHQDDTHVLNVHVPTNDSMTQFETQIVPLAKLVVDFLNQSEIAPSLTTPPEQGGSITKLERLLEEQSLPTEPLCGVLRRIQGARSKAAAHRKGDDFDRERLLGEASDPRDLFARLLEQLIAGMQTLRAALAG